MKTMTTTQLRTQSTTLISLLKKQMAVNLIHRSKIVGVILPAEPEPKLFSQQSVDQLQQAAAQLNLPVLSEAQRKQRYQKKLMEKHGTHLS